MNKIQQHLLQVYIKQKQILITIMEIMNLMVKMK